MESKRVNRKHFIADSKNKVKDIHSVIQTSARRFNEEIRLFKERPLGCYSVLHIDAEG